MNPKALIDLHCDTLTDCRPTPAGNPDTLDDPERVLSLSAMPEDVHWAQFYAVFIPDEYRGQAAIEYFEQNRENFFRQMKKFSQRAAPCRTYADMERAWAGNQTAASHHRERIGAGRRPEPRPGAGRPGGAGGDAGVERRE